MLQKENRLKKRGSFSFVYKKGERKYQGAIRLVYFPMRAGVKIGFSLSTKVGKAVKRNLIRRRLQAIIREFISTIKPVQAVVVVNPEAVELSYDQLKKATQAVFARAKLIQC